MILLQTPAATIHHADALEVAKSIESDTIDFAVIAERMTAAGFPIHVEIAELGADYLETYLPDVENAARQKAING